MPNNATGCADDLRGGTVHDAIACGFQGAQHSTCAQLLAAGIADGLREPGRPEVSLLRARNATGHLGITDDLEGVSGEPTRDLGFCLARKMTYVCGFAKTLHLSDKAELDATPTVKAFIEGIEID